jgi:tetratricopeptide (TPR) repeat protein
LTQSNLALALSHAGDDESAIELFEEAAATLRDLGDEEHEAQIMANLGLAHRRHGRREEGDNVLELALTKLSPESSAYHTIEAELRRAS